MPHKAHEMRNNVCHQMILSAWRCGHSQFARLVVQNQIERVTDGARGEGLASDATFAALTADERTVRKPPHPVGHVGKVLRNDVVVGL